MADYDAFANNTTDRSVITTKTQNNTSVTTLEKTTAGQEDTVYADFLKQVLNEDYIMEVGTFLLKIDMANNRGFAINSQEPNAYQTLKNNDLNANGLFIFGGDEDFATEVLEKVEAGELTATTYQAFLAAARSCPGADRKTAKEIRAWDRRFDKGACSAGGNYYIYGMDNKVVYEKYVFYFSLQSKIKSYQACVYKNPNTAPGYNAQLKLIGTVRYKKRCDDEQSRSVSLSETSRELNWRPFESNRSLSHYYMEVRFDIDHPNNTPFVSHLAGPYIIRYIF